MTQEFRPGAIGRSRLMLGILLVLTIPAVAGCLSEISDSEEVPSQGDSHSEIPMRHTFSNCAYHETLLVVSVDEAKNLVPPNYSPVNGITGDEETAIIFLPYLGCEEKWVLVGVTVRPPADAPGVSDHNGYLLGVFVEDDSNNVSKFFAGQLESAIISQAILGPTSHVEVESNLSMFATHAVRNDIMSSSPFSLRLFSENNGERSTLGITASDLERENSIGTFEANSLFGHQIPPAVPIAFVGNLSDLVLEQLE